MHTGRPLCTESSPDSWPPSVAAQPMFMVPSFQDDTQTPQDLQGLGPLAFKPPCCCPTEILLMKARQLTRALCIQRFVTPADRWTHQGTQGLSQLYGPQPPRALLPAIADKALVAVQQQGSQGICSFRQLHLSFGIRPGRRLLAF